MKSTLLSLLLASLLTAGCAARAVDTETQPPLSGVVFPAASEASAATNAGAPASLNEGFRDADLDVASFVRRFEIESREVFAQRELLVDVLGLEPGEAVADIGSGTGLFSILFAREVGRDGRVYGVDISPRFIDHLSERAFILDLPQMQPVLCTASSTNLPEDSVDAAFICDTYHHFEVPMETMSSLRQALRPGGRLVLVDFERIPGVSRPWLVNHVRCGKQTVIAEVEAAGFRLVATPRLPGMLENYVLVFEQQ